MDKLVYIIYGILPVMLFMGARVMKKREWNEEFLSLSQTKAIQGFSAVCIMLHHIAQKTCASWLDSYLIIPGLELFVPIGYFFVGIFLFSSGYGLMKSYREKPGYLQGFVKKRILPVVLAFYTTGIIFLIARYLMGEKISGSKLFFYLSGMQLSNPNAWYVIALPIFYLGFYLAFRFAKNERVAVLITCMVVLVYTLLGTCVDHNDWWLRGEWWYNSVHLFSLGILFAGHEKQIIPKIKKNYWVYLILAFVGIFIWFSISEYAQAQFSYYGENWGAPDKVARRWICLVTQMLASCSFVFFVFLMGMKIRIGNRFLKFMGTITMEFYLIHGLFVELFAYSFAGVVPGLYRVKNVALYIALVFILALPSAILLQKLHQFLLRKK